MNALFMILMTGTFSTCQKGKICGTVESLCVALTFMGFLAFSLFYITRFTGYYLLELSGILCIRF